MSARGHATILGGLPIVADVSFGRDGWTGEYWAEVDALYWMKRDGTAGKPLPQKVIDRAAEYDYGFCYVIEQVSDYLALQEQPEPDSALLLLGAPPQDPKKETP